MSNGVHVLIVFYLLGCLSAGISLAMATLYFFGNLTWPWYSPLIHVGTFVCVGIGLRIVGKLRIDLGGEG